MSDTFNEWKADLGFQRLNALTHCCRRKSLVPGSLGDRAMFRDVQEAFEKPGLQSFFFRPRKLECGFLLLSID